jgi:hypothetical protein
MASINEALGAADGSSRDEKQRGLFNSVKRSIMTGLSKDPLSAHGIMDLAAERSSRVLASLFRGSFGLPHIAEVVGHELDPSTMTKVGETVIKPPLEGSILGLAVVAARDANLDDQKKISSFLTQPILDADGNPYKITRGLSARYKKARSLGMSPVDSIFSFVEVDYDEGSPVTPLMIFEFLAPQFDYTDQMRGNRRGNPAWQGTQKGVSVRQYLGAPRPNSRGNAVVYEARTWNGTPVEVQGETAHQRLFIGSIPVLSAFRKKGIPATVLSRDRNDTLPPVSPEDTGPLLDALAHVAAVLGWRKPDDLLPAPLLATTFDSVPDRKIAGSAVSLRDLLRPLTDEQKIEKIRAMQREALEEILFSSLDPKRTEVTPAGVVDVENPDNNAPFVNTFSDIIDIDPHDGSYITNPELEKALGHVIENTALVTEHWDGLPTKQVTALKQVALDLGSDRHIAYGGSVVATSGVFDVFAESSHREFVAELISYLTYGVPLPLWTKNEHGDMVRRSLTAIEIESIQALMSFILPGLKYDLASQKGESND